MSEEDKEQRTEEASPKRQEKLREEGKFPQSPDVTSAAMVGAVALIANFMGQTVVRNTMLFAHRAFRLQDKENPTEAVSALLRLFGTSVLPSVTAVTLIAIAIGVAQSRGLFRISLAAPNFERLNPMPQLERMFSLRQAFGEIGKQLIKVLVIGVVVYNVIAGVLASFTQLASSEPSVGASIAGRAVSKIATYGIVGLALLAAADYWFAYRKFQEESKMSREEIRRERKEEEGDPLIKRRMRQRMREAARRRSISDVSKATVLVTNPTHISVALRYNPEEDPAPILIAKGIDDIALQMRAKARQHNIPIMESKPFARALHKSGRIGEPIPVELYTAAAQIIAHVMKLRGGMA